MFVYSFMRTGGQTITLIFMSTKRSMKLPSNPLDKTTISCSAALSRSLTTLTSPPFYGGTVLVGLKELSKLKSSMLPPKLRD